MIIIPDDGAIVTVAMGDDDVDGCVICSTPEGAWIDVAPDDPNASGTILWFDAPAFESEADE